MVTDKAIRLGARSEGRDELDSKVQTGFGHTPLKANTVLDVRFVDVCL